MKITDFETPTGQRGNILNPMSWWSMVLGVIVFLATLSLGQKLGASLGAKTGGILNTNPQQPFLARPTPAPVSNVRYIG